MSSPRFDLTEAEWRVTIVFSRRLDRKRNLIERFFCKIKRYRRVATRYDKLAENFLANVKLASIVCGCGLMSPRPHAGELRPVALRAGDLLLVHATAAGGLQRGALEGEILASVETRA